MDGDRQMDGDRGLNVGAKGQQMIPPRGWLTYCVTLCPASTGLIDFPLSLCVNRKSSCETEWVRWADEKESPRSLNQSPPAPSMQHQNLAVFVSS